MLSLKLCPKDSEHLSKGFHIVLLNIVLYVHIDIYTMCDSATVPIKKNYLI